MIELLKEMFGPIAATIKSYVTNEYNAFLYEDNMVKLLESNYYSRMKIKNILHNSGQKGTGTFSTKLSVMKDYPDKMTVEPDS